MNNPTNRPVSPAKNTVRAALHEAPPLLTKDWLCARFRFFSGRRYQLLRKHVLTDAVLQQAGIPPEDYARIRGTFTREQTNVIVKILEL